MQLLEKLQKMGENIENIIIITENLLEAEMRKTQMLMLTTLFIKGYQYQI